MVTKSKAPTTLEEAPEAAPAADAPVENAAAEGEVDGAAKKKKVKKVIPSWATISDDVRAKLAKSGSLAKPKLTDAIFEAIKMCGDSKGVASASAIKAMIMSDNPELPKVALKKAMLKAVDKGLVAQVKGKGFSGSVKLGKGKPEKKAETAPKKPAKGKKAGKEADSGPREPLEILFPLVFTWAINPKEASVGLIKKYLDANYPDLDLGVDLKHYKKALENAEKSGSLERLTGKGYSGTFRLVDGAPKSSSIFADAFENACIAMNDPKELSVSKLRDYLGYYHPEYKTDDRPQVLKRALERAVDKGWLTQISGKGFAGTYRLMHPYYPSPRELWGKDFQETKEPKEAKEKTEAVPKKKAAKRAKSESEDESEDDDFEEEAYIPKKRGAPTPRKTAEAPPKKAKTVAAKKAKADKPAKSKPTPAKKDKKGKGKK